ncbi:transcription factor bHLH30-like [Tripterygium wilfordii]|uniref:Transcription factor bHLH30-like n=1 Tax=Tripterygium wilfordii TaxID=458696 RepID=A0A7J7D7L5_TRIWF|nr:transcription factor bHLH30-like [Tripterygium wilfordii]KAF5742337.1 transcription factor bHLH30-like [Tripterygium wilfordii]
MAAYSQNPNSNHGSGYLKTLDPFSRDLGGFNGVLPGGSLMGSQSLVLDNERGELVKAPSTGGKKGMSEAKTLAALKSHSEAERRRRERINAHLATLRGLVPCSEKMDKATLLAEVITQVKELKKNAIDATKGLLIPMDDDEVNVEPYNDVPGDGTSFFRASLCCDYRPDLLSDLRQALDTLHLKMVKSEVSTLEGRLKNSFVFTTSTEKNVDDAEIKQVVSSVHQALNSVLDKCSSSPEYSPRTTLPNKKRRISFFDSSSSSS